MRFCSKKASMKGSSSNSYTPYWVNIPRLVSIEEGLHISLQTSFTHVYGEQYAFIYNYDNALRCLNIQLPKSFAATNI